MVQRIFTFEGPLTDGGVNGQMERDDGGLARIAYIPVHPNTQSDVGMECRLHSWDTQKKHSWLTGYEGKRVRVTVELIDD